MKKARVLAYCIAPDTISIEGRPVEEWPVLWRTRGAIIGKDGRPVSPQGVGPIRVGEDAIRAAMLVSKFGPIYKLGPSYQDIIDERIEAINRNDFSKVIDHYLPEGIPCWVIAEGQDYADEPVAFISVTGLDGAHFAVVPAQQITPNFVDRE